MKWTLFLVFALTACGSSSSSPGRFEPCAEPAETSGTWVTMTLPPANVGALKPAFAWTGNELVVWSGLGLHSENGGCVPCNGGAAYDAKRNSWRALNDVGAPPARDWTEGVWTGKYFVTWGGLPAAAQYFTAIDKVGGIYDLAGDVWHSVSASGQPQWRWLHVLEWTGREVLVWGGTDLSNVPLCDGGRFDPEQNSWRTMTVEGAPEGCAGSARAWTGHELLVWGGQKGPPHSEEDTNTGAAYNPETDSWRPISNKGAPSARYNPATVWTGEEMIVYGGNAGVDARAYNPTTDSWRNLSLRDAPGLHVRGDAVWTGSEMLLWGRTDCDVGGRYDVATDTWKAFSSQGVLLPRSYQSMVWTGDALLIYGGTIGTEQQEDTNSGALFTP